MPASQPARFVTGGAQHGYWRFYLEVASAQLAAWLPAEPGRVLDLSTARPDVMFQVARAGHDVIKIVNSGRMRPTRLPDRIHVVAGEDAQPAYLADGAVDAVVAESRALSLCLATETTVDEAARVLRPGGRMLVCVDSLVLGMAQLAKRRCWAELSDAPRADVLLVPAADGTITRCFWPEQLHEMLTEAGLDVEWVRPRTVLSPTAVEGALATNPEVLPDLVRAELTLARDSPDDSLGIHLLASARRPRRLRMPRSRRGPSARRRKPRRSRPAPSQGLLGGNV